MKRATLHDLDFTVWDCVFRRNLRGILPRGNEIAAQIVRVCPAWELSFRDVLDAIWRLEQAGKLQRENEGWQVNQA